MSQRDGATAPLSATSVAATVAFAALFAGALDPLLRAVATAGRFLPAHALETDYIAGVLWAIALGASILVWPVPSRDRLTLVVVWAVKVIVTLVLMLPYEWNYPTLDAYGYYSVALQPAPDWELVGLGAGTENVSALTWLHNQVIPGSYHAAKVSFAMCGLLAVYVFYRAARIADHRASPRLLYGLALFPSILFWSSILGKDPLILLGIALYCLGVVGWRRHGRGSYLMWALAGAALAVAIRLWMGVILAAPLAALVVLRARGVLARTGWLVAGALILYVGTRLFWQRFALETVSDIVSTANTWSQGWAEGGSAQLIESEFTGIRSMIAFVPKGMFTALFRPLPGEVMNPFGLLAGLENAVILALLARAVVRTRWAELRDPLVLWAILLILVWAAIYGFVSYQNLGTAVRFRLQILPVLLLLLLYLGRARGGGDLATAEVSA
jgi:hypothetical protein